MNPQAHYQGFIEKCAEYGINGNEMYKYAAIGDDIISALSWPGAGALGGGLLGAGAGALLAPKTYNPQTGRHEKDYLKGIALGGLGGAGLGVGGGALFKSLMKKKLERDLMENPFPWMDSQR